MTTKTQTRGHCQLCGREQAYHRGAIAKHGYTVDWNQFNGVCQGADYRPLEIDRTELDRVVARLRDKDIPAMKAEVEKLRGGWTPEEVAVEVHGQGTYFGKRYIPKTELKPFAEVYREDYAVRSWREQAIWRMERRIKGAGQFADDLIAMAERVHGQPMREVKKAEAPAHIERGEKRKLESGSVVEALRQEGARVYWKRERDGFKGWTGTQAWRKLEVVA